MRGTSTNMLMLHSFPAYTSASSTPFLHRRKLPQHQLRFLEVCRMLVGKPACCPHFLEHRKFLRAVPCRSRIKVSAMLLRLGSFRFRNIGGPPKSSPSGACRP